MYLKILIINLNTENTWASDSVSRFIRYFALPIRCFDTICSNESKKRSRSQGRSNSLTSLRTETCLLLGKACPLGSSPLSSALSLKLTLLDRTKFVVVLFLSRHVTVSNVVTFRHAANYRSVNKLHSCRNCRLMHLHLVLSPFFLSNLNKNMSRI